MGHGCQIQTAAGWFFRDITPPSYPQKKGTCRRITTCYLDRYMYDYIIHILYIHNIYIFILYTYIHIDTVHVSAVGYIFWWAIRCRQRQKRIGKERFFCDSLRKIRRAKQSPFAVRWAMGIHILLKKGRQGNLWHI